jgi:hypothetical protein
MFAFFTRIHSALLSDQPLQIDESHACDEVAIAINVISVPTKFSLMLRKMLI